MKFLLAALNAKYALVADVPGSIEVRLADTQGNRILHFADNIEKFPDSGRFNRNDCIRKGISHGVIISLWSSYLRVRIVP